MKRRMATVAGLAVVVLTAAACGGGASGDDATAARTTASQETSTEAVPTPSTSSSASGSVGGGPSSGAAEGTGSGQGPDLGVECGVDTEAPAITAALGVLSERQPSPYGWTYFGDANYDPCADLSYAMAETPQGTVSSPMQLMLFHRGEYVGTGTQCALGYTTVIGGTDGSVDVRYRWPRGDDANANPTGEATTTYRWIGGGVEMTDPLPAELLTEC